MLRTKESFNDEQIKKIVISILTKEFKEHNLDYSIAVGTIGEYKKAVKSNNEHTRKEKANFIKSLGADTIAYHSESNKCIVFFSDRIRKYETLEKQLFVIIFSCFHEVRHAIQKKYDEFSYEKFLYDIECIFRKKNEKHYVDNHDLYSFEIGADLYAITRTIQIMKSVYPSIYEKEKPFIEGMKRRTIDNYYLYNAYFFVNDLFADIVNSREVPDLKVLKIFFNEDGSFKKIDEIINDKDYEKLDKRIVYFMLSSPLALINVEEESDFGLNLLKRSNEYVLKVHNNQEKYIAKNQK